MTEGSFAQQDDYLPFAQELIAGGILTDPWLEGKPRFQSTPVMCPEQQILAMYDVAERIGEAVHEACVLCHEQPALLDDFLGLTPFQKLMWASSAPMWHAFGRVDLFTTAEGIVGCEINADTPTGQPEAVLLNKYASVARPGMKDPNVGFEDRFCSLVETIASASFGDDFDKTLGLVYPTELTEDLPLIRCYKAWLGARGWKVVLGSPFNLGQTKSGRICLLGEPCKVILRHYKTDWWGERLPSWLDEDPYPDPEPLREPLGILVNATTENRCVVINPFGAVVAQNKRLFALMCENAHLFSEQAQETIRMHIPHTVRLESMHRQQLSAEREQWVLKSDYGCEGSEVVLGKHCTQDIWDESLAQAAPGHWVAQRYFEATENDAGEVANWGVYLFGGEASGMYVRLQAGATDVFARSAPVLIPAEDA